MAFHLREEPFKILTLIQLILSVVQARVDVYQDNAKGCFTMGNPGNCTVGHCCEGDGCCTYYYELWWFWLIWALIILMSCCCAYHHRKKRQSLRAQRANRGNGQEPYAGACNYPGPPVDKGVIGYSKLPKYEDIIRIPPSASPPPPYSERRAMNSLACLERDSEGVTSMTLLSYSELTSSVLSLVSQLGISLLPKDSSDRIKKRTSKRRQNYDEEICSQTAVENSCTANNPPTNIPTLVTENETTTDKAIHIIHCKQNVERDKNALEGESIELETATKEPFQKERRRQDSGIEMDGHNEDHNNDISIEQDHDNADKIVTKPCTKILPEKHSNLRKASENSGYCPREPVNIGRDYVSSDEDTESMMSEDDNKLNLDFNNNGTVPLRYLYPDYFRDPIHETYSESESKRGSLLSEDLGIGTSHDTSHGHGDFVLNLSLMDAGDNSECGTLLNENN